MLTQVNYEVKGQLAKLLATEDLIKETRKESKASFDEYPALASAVSWICSPSTRLKFSALDKSSGIVFAPTFILNAEKPSSFIFFASSVSFFAPAIRQIMGSSSRCFIPISSEKVFF